MLRVHFLNVGHGDCTLIQHDSGRLTMVDINTSQEYDPDSFNELWAEEARKQYNPLAAGFGIGGGAQSAAVNALFGTPPGYGQGAAPSLECLRAISKRWQKPKENLRTRSRSSKGITPDKRSGASFSLTPI